MAHVYCNGSALVIQHQGEDSYISKEMVEKGIVQWDGCYLRVLRDGETTSIELSIPSYESKAFRDKLENSIRSLLSD